MLNLDGSQLLLQIVFLNEFGSRKKRVENTVLRCPTNDIVENTARACTQCTRTLYCFDCFVVFLTLHLLCRHIETCCHAIVDYGHIIDYNGLETRHKSRSTVVYGHT